MAMPSAHRIVMARHSGKFLSEPARRSLAFGARRA
jgi:hypothetical protein